MTAGLRQPRRLGLLLLALLVGCTDSVTALRVVVARKTPQIDELVVYGWVDGALRVAGRRFTLPSDDLQGDLVLLFPDSDAGKPASLTIEGHTLGALAAWVSVDATLRRGETVEVTARLGWDPDGGVDTGPDASCLGSRCQGDDLVGCADAGLVTTSCPLGCVEQPVARCRRLVPSNGVAFTLTSPEDLVLPAGAAVFINTSTGKISGTIAAPAMFQVPQAGAPTITVFVFRSINIGPTAIVKATGANALALLSEGPIVLDGLLDGSASGIAGGPGGGRGADLQAGATGPGAGLDGKYDSGGGFAGGGGGGSHAAAGGAGGAGGTVSGGVAKPFSLVETLEPLLGGSGGGRGGRGGTAINAGRGGGGGGAVQIVSGTSISIGGGINVGGEGGKVNNNILCGGGGAGSGGSILLEAPAVSLHTATLAANGGGGAGGSATGGAVAGASGDLSAGVAKGGAGTPATGGDGGAGGAKKGPKGKNGIGALEAGGGGGGGLGAVRINTRTGSAEPSGAVISAQVSWGKVKTK